jgi:tRNA (Thr-GGU) A37 N-methylase
MTYVNNYAVRTRKISRPKKFRKICCLPKSTLVALINMADKDTHRAFVSRTPIRPNHIEIPIVEIHNINEI